MSFVLQCENHHRRTFGGSSAPASEALALSLSFPLLSLMRIMVASDLNSSLSCIDPSTVAEVNIAGPGALDAIGDEVVRGRDAIAGVGAGSGGGDRDAAVGVVIAQVGIKFLVFCFFCEVRSNGECERECFLAGLVTISSEPSALICLILIRSRSFL